MSLLVTHYLSCLCAKSGFVQKTFVLWLSRTHGPFLICLQLRKIYARNSSEWEQWDFWEADRRKQMLIDHWNGPFVVSGAFSVKSIFPTHMSNSLLVLRCRCTKFTNISRNFLFFRFSLVSLLLWISTSTRLCGVRAEAFFVWTIETNESEPYAPIAHRWGSLLCITLNIWVMCWASSDPHLWAMLDNSLTLDWYCVRTTRVALATRVVLTQYQSRARELSYTYGSVKLLHDRKRTLVSKCTRLFVMFYGRLASKSSKIRQSTHQNAHAHKTVLGFSQSISCPLSSDNEAVCVFVPNAVVMQLYTCWFSLKWVDRVGLTFLMSSVLNCSADEQIKQHEELVAVYFNGTVKWIPPAIYRYAVASLGWIKFVHSISPLPKLIVSAQKLSTDIGHLRDHGSLSNPWPLFSIRPARGFLSFTQNERSLLYVLLLVLNGCFLQYTRGISLLSGFSSICGSQSGRRILRFFRGWPGTCLHATSMLWSLSAHARDSAWRSNVAISDRTGGGDTCLSMCGLPQCCFFFGFCCCGWLSPP